jgi:hypothetical protein
MMPGGSPSDPSTVTVPVSPDPSITDYYLAFMRRGSGLTADSFTLSSRLPFVR